MDQQLSVEEEGERGTHRNLRERNAGEREEDVFRQIRRQTQTQEGQGCLRITPFPKLV